MSLSGETEDPCSALDLSPESQRVQVERSGSPAPSCVSTKSENSMEYPINLKGGEPCHSSGITLHVTQSLLHQGNVAERSDMLCHLPLGHRLQQCEDPDKTDRSAYFQLTFKSLHSTLGKLTKDELKKFGGHVGHCYPECFEVPQDSDPAPITEKIMEACGEERALKITLHVLRSMNCRDLADSLEREENRIRSIKAGQQKVKDHLKRRHECISEGVARHGSSVLLNDIYTELHITEGAGEGVSEGHDMRTGESETYETPEMQKVQRSVVEGTPVKCNDIFKHFAGCRKPIRTVLTKGIAGIGKTISVRKFILDWAEGKANGHIHFIFPLSFRDLNLRKGNACSLQQLLHLYFPELKGLEHVEFDELNILLILDGLDECRLPLDFHSNGNLFDVRQSTSLDVLLTNVIKGNLLPSAFLWITSRPDAATRLPAECVHRVAEIRGFRKQQTQEYFVKKVRDVDLAHKVMAHIKKSKGLCTMCHIPVFCWILATALEAILSDESENEVPTTLTQLYASFLLIQSNMKTEKYSKSRDPSLTVLSHDDKELIQKLARLAFHQLEKGNVTFYEEDLKECGIDVTRASLCSGLCTEIFPGEDVVSQGKVYGFVHLSVQEFLAALHVFNSYANTGKNLLEPEPRTGAACQGKAARITLFDVHKSAVDKALGSKSAHPNLFLRFLLGLGLESTRSLPLQGVLASIESRPHDLQTTARYLRQNIEGQVSPQVTSDLVHCLREVERDHAWCVQGQGNLTHGSHGPKEGDATRSRRKT